MGSRSSRSSTSTSTSTNGSSAAPRAQAFDAEAVAEAAVNGRAEAAAEQAASARAEAAAAVRGVNFLAMREAYLREAADVESDVSRRFWAEAERCFALVLADFAGPEAAPAIVGGDQQ